jgi:nucleotide-binding universal stress UspA family protein
MKPELLIVTNGFKGTWLAIEYGAWLAETMQLKVTLLGVSEKLRAPQMDDNILLEEIFARSIELFQKRGVEYNLEVQNGDAEHVIPQIANKGNFITVVSPLGRPQLRRWFTGRSIRSFMEKIKGPILYVPVIRLPLKKLLISAGGLGYEVDAENLAFQVATASRADVTILHVVPPTGLDYQTTRDVRGHVKDLADTDTLLGRSLREALSIAQNAGLNAKLITRQGNVVEEILAEIKEGNYDMACMGSSYSTHTLRQLYTPNVTAEVAEAELCPVLTVRHMPV